VDLGSFLGFPVSRKLPRFTKPRVKVIRSFHDPQSFCPIAKSCIIFLP
jgi:hypothetical protein